MNGNIRILTIFGIPINVNISWFLTLAFVTSMLALRLYPQVFPPGSPYRDDIPLHWAMAIVSGFAFFGSILAHELAHSLIARHQGISVKGITLFIFGGVSQIASESRRPLHEFIMAIAGPLTSVFLGALCFVLWWLVADFHEDQPVALILEWLFFMNIVVGLFNLAPGFPMDGGRVVRATLWGITGDYTRATRWATRAGRGVGYFLVGLGVISVLGVFNFVDSISGLWFIVLGLFLEQAARQSWLQSEGLRHLGEFRAADIMNRDIDTIDRYLKVRTLTTGPSPRRRFIYFVSGPNERVTGVVTEKEIDALDPVKRPFATAEEAMTPAESAAFAGPADNGARLLELMEAADVRHLPIVDDGLVVGVVSKENLLRLVGRGIARRPKLARA